MILTLTITFYHGTSLRNLESIVKDGFCENTISMGTTRKDWAKGYGDCLIEFKYPYKIHIKDVFWLLKEWIINNDLAVCVAGFKPNKTKIKWIEKE